MVAIGLWRMSNCNDNSQCYVTMKFASISNLKQYNHMKCPCSMTVTRPHTINTYYKYFTVYPLLLQFGSSISFNFFSSKSHKVIQHLHTNMQNTLCVHNWSSWQSSKTQFNSRALLVSTLSILNTYQYIMKFFNYFLLTPCPSQSPCTPSSWALLLYQLL